MAKIWKRTRNSANKSQLHEIDTATLVISSPTVIYLSGFLTVDNNPDFIAGGIKRLEELLHDRPELSPPPQIYLWSHTNLRNIFNLAAYNLRPQCAYSAAAEKLARAVILPLVSKNGQPLPAEEVQKNLRNLTLFGYSAGTIVAQETFNASMQLMQGIGYKAEDARSLLQEIVLVSVGNVSRPTQEINRFTTLYLAASNDLAVRWKNRLWRPLKTIFAKYARNLTIKPLSATSLLITAAVSKKMWELKKNIRGAWEKRSIRPLIPSWLLIKSYHELPHYITSDDGHSQFSKIALHGIINAINRKEKPDVMKLLEPVTSHTTEEIAAYRERIARAMVKKA